MITLKISADNDRYYIFAAILNIIKSVISQGSNEFVIGRTYIIPDKRSGDDFSNIGFVQEGEPFTATAATPSIWENGTQAFDVELSKPDVYELENTLGPVNVKLVSNNKIQIVAPGKIHENTHGVDGFISGRYYTGHREDQDTYVIYFYNDKNDSVIPLDQEITGFLLQLYIPKP